MQPELIRLENIIKYYGAKIILDGVHLSLSADQRGGQINIAADSDRAEIC